MSPVKSISALSRLATISSLILIALVLALALAGVTRSAAPPSQGASGNAGVRRSTPSVEDEQAETALRACLEAFEAAFRQSPEAAVALGKALRQLRRFDEVIALEKQLLADFPEIWRIVEKAYPELGYAGAWGKAADVLAKYYGKGQTAMDIADRYLLGGDKANELRWLEKAYEERNPNLLGIAILPDWDGLRSEPGFKALLRKMNLPQ